MKLSLSLSSYVPSKTLTSQYRNVCDPSPISLFLNASNLLKRWPLSRPTPFFYFAFYNYIKLIFFHLLIPSTLGSILCSVGSDTSAPHLLVMDRSYHRLLTGDSEPSPSKNIGSAWVSPENDVKAASDVHQFDSKGIYESGSSGCSDTKMKQRNRGLKDNKEMRRHRYAFQTRSQVDILDDGYRWRKYGQKTVKNSKFPRSYYKCTHKGCNVKKQVQRNSKEEEIVVTTYEGIHTHPTERSNENFEEILKHMQTYTPFLNMNFNHLV